MNPGVIAGITVGVLLCMIFLIILITLIITVVVVVYFQFSSYKSIYYTRNIKNINTKTTKRFFKKLKGDKEYSRQTDNTTQGDITITV